MAELDEPLSDRELEVLELLAEGATNKEIAADLFISPNTVKVHLRNINTKLGSRSRTEASRIALERGILKIQGMELVEQNEETPAETEPVIDIEPEVLDSTSQPEPSPPAQTPANNVEKRVSSNMPQVYLAGGVIAVLILLGIVAWFAFSRPNATMIEELASTPTPFEPDELGDRWFAGQMLPESLTAASAVAIGTDVYLIGGRQADGMLNNELHVYDSAEHVWRTATGPPEALLNSAAVSIEQQIFVIGGQTADEQESDTVGVYSPTENSWQFAASLPKPLSNGLALSSESQLYHLGGQAEGVAVADVYLFDRGANAWNTLPNIPEARSGATGGVVSGNLYVIGGTNENGEATSSCFQLDLTENVWTDCASMGNGRIDAAGTVILDKIYVIGGETNAVFGELYDPASDLWEKIEQPMLEDLDSPSWKDASIARVESKVYLLGGEFNGTLSRDAFFYWPLVYQSFIPSASSTDP